MYLGRLKKSIDALKVVDSAHLDHASVRTDIDFSSLAKRSKSC